MICHKLEISLIIDQMQILDCSSSEVLKNKKILTI